MPRLSVYMIRAALLHLGIGFALGALLLWNKGLPFDGRIWLLLTSHIELVLLGWTMQLAMGAAFWIMPRFSAQRRRYGKVTLGWLAFGFINIGVAAVVLSGWWNALLLPGRVLELLAAICFAAHLFPRVKPLGGQAASETSG